MLSMADCQFHVPLGARIDLSLVRIAHTTDTVADAEFWGNDRHIFMVVLDQQAFRQCKSLR